MGYHLRRKFVLWYPSNSVTCAKSMAVRGIRGATTADVDTQTAVIEATTEMLQSTSSDNRLDPADIAGVWFTTTRHLTAEFPAVAARRMGWTAVPVVCRHVMEVP